MPEPKRIEVDDITDEMREAARQVVREVMAWQCEPAEPVLGHLLLNCDNIAFRESLCRFFHSPYYSSSHSHLDSLLLSSLDSSLSSTLLLSLDSSLFSLLEADLQALSTPLLSLHSSLSLSLKCVQMEMRFVYCGVYWNWWLMWYLIACVFGVKFNMKHLSLFYAFCRYTPLVGSVETENGETVLVPLPKPETVKLVEVGTTNDELALPIFELHAESEPSVVHKFFEDYHLHNTRVPACMGKTKPSEWCVEWLVDETNSEVRTLLLSQFGNEKVVRELGVRVVESYGEYSLLRVPVKGEALQFLEVRTKETHLVRVPPEVERVGDAVRWVKGPPNFFRVGSITPRIY